MEKLLLRYIILTGLVCCLFGQRGYGQRYVTNLYGYAIYNFFDNNTVDNTNNNNVGGVFAPGFLPDPNVAGNNTSVIVSASAAANNLSSATGRSLTSKYQATPKAISADFIPNAADASFKNINNNDWEWSLLYKSNLTGTNYPTTPPTNITTGLSNTANSWRYWLFSNTSTLTGSTGGFYLTQDASGKLVVYVVTGGTAYTLISSNAALTNGTTYCIKIQRLVGGSWRMYLDPYAPAATTPVTQAKTLQTSKTVTSDGQAITLTYNTTFLEAENTSGNDGLFQWDEIHMYTRYLKFENVTSASNNVTQPPYSANTNVILWGTKLLTRGNYELGSNSNADLTIAHTDVGSGVSNFVNNLNPATLYRTTNAAFSTNSPTTILTSNLLFFDGTGNAQTSNSGYSDSEVSSGNIDGTLSTPSYWFIGATTKSTVNSANTITINGVNSTTQNVNSSSVTGTTSYAATASAPAVNTTAPSAITSTSASVGGTVTSAGSSNITEYGVVYSTSNSTPTTSNSKYSMGTTIATGSTYSATLTGLASGTLYYLRAYTINSVGTSYGAVSSFTTSGTAIAAPAISYPTPQFYTVGTTINSLSPTNTGGATGGYAAGVIFPASNTIKSNGIAVNPTNGDVYITSDNTNALYKYDATGALSTGFPQTGYSQPAGVIVDAAGNTYVANRNVTFTNGFISKRTAAGVVTTITGFQEPTALAMDASGNIYVVDRNSTVANGGAIYKINANSTVAGTAYISGLNSPWGIAVNAGGDLYVSAIGSSTNGAGLINVIYKYASGSTTQTTFVSSGLSSPRNMVVDGAGNLYEADAGNGGLNIRAINMISPAGVLTQLFTTSDSPTAIALDASGNFYYSGFNNPNVLKSTASGYSITPSLPTGLYFDNFNGVISGIPTATSASTNYTVIATNSGGSSNSTLNITVNSSAYLGTYAYRLPISLNTTGLGISSNLTKFPVLLKIVDPGLIVTTGGCSNRVQFPNGPAYDFAFTDPSASTTELPYQVESYDQTTGTLLVWVQIPTIYKAVNNSLSFYYGNATAPSTHITTFYQNTWKSVNTTSSNYNGVWHFNEAPSNSTATLLDATGSGNNLKSFNTGATQNTTSIIGNGIQLSSSNVSATVTGYPALNTNLTMSVWAKFNSAPTSNQNMMVLIGNNNNADQMAYRSSATPQVANYGGGTVVSSNATVDNTWHHIVYTYNSTGGSSSIFVDGVFKTASTATAPQTGTVTNIFFGDYANGAGEYLNGFIDEAHVINTSLSADWIKAEYVNQLDPGSFTIEGTTAADATNVATILGGVTYTYNGSTYTPNVTGASTTPTFNGKENFIYNSSITLTGIGSANAVTVNSGATLALSGQTLNVACNFVNNGTITYGNTSSNITFNGSSAQSYTAGATSNTASVGNITINNSAGSTITISGGPVDLYNLLTITKGNLAIAASSVFTLKSTSSITASIAAIPPSYNVTGTATVERWFKGGSASDRGYRLMSSPVNNTPAIPVTAASTFDYLSLKDNLIFTGSGTGFDNSTSIPGYTVNGATVLLYNTATDNFSPLASLTTAATSKVGTGFYFFFRGNRTNMASKVIRSGSPAVFASPEANVVGLQKGTLNQQGFNYTLLTTGTKRFNVVGNPYPSSITITSAFLANTTPFVYTYSPGPGGSSINPFSPPYQIASGQGFVVKALAAGGTLPFTESLKTAGQPASLLFNSTESQEGEITLQMIQDSVNYDLAQLRFADTYKKPYDELEDADDLNGSGQTVFFGAMTADNHLVAIASQPIEKQRTSIFLSVNDNTSGLFSIKRMDLSNIPAAYDVWLMDHFKKDSLDLRVHDNYNFNIDKANTATFGNSRFEVVIRKKVLPPYKLLNFVGNKSTTGNLLDWNTLNEYDYTTFELQKSTDGKNFETIQLVQSASLGSYNYKDINIAKQDLYYRLKQTDINDQISYSNVVIIVSTQGNGSLNIFPNPATNSIQFSLNEKITSSVGLRIFNSMGILMKSSTFTAATGQQDITSLIPGSYTIKLIDLQSKKLLLTGKFIKI